MRAWRLGREGASTVLDATPTSVPVGALHPALLDASLHGIPADASVFSAALSPELAPLPYRVPTLHVYGPAPTSGEVRCEVRFSGAGEGDRFPEFLIQLVHGERVWLSWVITMIGLPKGSIGMALARSDAAASLPRQALRPRRAPPRKAAGVTTLTRESVQRSRLAPRHRRGRVRRVRRRADRRPRAPRPSPRRPPVHRALGRHEPPPPTSPSPLPARVETEGSLARVADAGAPRLDLASTSAWWRSWLGPGTRAVEDLFFALVRRFVGRVVLVDPEGFAALPRPAVLYLANHQTMVESLMFVVLLGPLADVPTLGLAKIEHRDSWIGHLSRAVAAWPGARYLLEFFDRNDKAALPGILQRIATRMATRRESLLVHVEGTRSLLRRRAVMQMRLRHHRHGRPRNAAIVPVHFAGGLPRESGGARLDFPLGYGRQDHWVGRAILPETLKAMPYGERRAAVVGAINATGPSPAAEMPNPGDPELADTITRWATRTGASTAHAAILTALAHERDLQPSWRRVLAGMESGTLIVEDTAEDRAVAAIAADLYGPRGPAGGGALGLPRRPGLGAPRGPPWKALPALRESTSAAVFAPNGVLDPACRGSPCPYTPGCARGRRR